MTTEVEEIKQLGMKLRDHKVDKEMAFGIAIRVGEINRQRMMDWLDENPKATPKECCLMSIKLRSVQSA